MLLLLHTSQSLVTNSVCRSDACNLLHTLPLDKMRVTYGEVQGGALCSRSEVFPNNEDLSLGARHRKLLLRDSERPVYAADGLGCFSTQHNLQAVSTQGEEKSIP